LQVVATPPVCFGGHDGRLQLLVESGNPPLRYSINGGEFGGSSVFIALSAGNYTLVVRDGSGCTASISSVLSQPPPVQVFVGLDTSLTLGDSLLLSATVDNAFGAVQLQWSSALADSLRCLDPSDCEEVWVKPAYTNTYRLKATDENGCMGTDEIQVRVLKPRGAYVPTAFTPNGDFENDLLLVHGKSRQIEKVVVFKVFDRWGETLYEDRDFSANDSTRGWNGTFKGQPCDPGVYVWLLEVLYKDGQTEWLNGNTTLIR
jgi:gliding motility-associated-like protein